MVPIRALAAGVIVALLATLAAPCFAVGPGDDAAMDSCKTMGHGDCDTAQLADTCCQTRDTNQHDRDLPPTTSAVKNPAAVAGLAVRTFVAEVPSALQLHATVPNAALFAISPARHCPLLI